MTRNREHYKHTWYTRIPEADRRTLAAMAEWLSPVDWQLFATLTFPIPRGLEKAKSNLRLFVNELERDLKGNICYVAGAERIPGLVGVEVSWHFHLIITAIRPLPPSQVE